MHLHLDIHIGISSRLYPHRELPMLPMSANVKLSVITVK